MLPSTIARPARLSAPVADKRSLNMTNGNTRPTYTLGISMAGAVSAGSYSAGVVDFLFEALDALEAAKSDKEDEKGKYRDIYAHRQDKGTVPIFDPKYDIKIGAMSGTSAGAMVTAIAASVAGAEIEPVYSKLSPDSHNGPIATKKTGNPFYDAWVLGHQDEGEYREYADQLLGVRDLMEKDSNNDVIVKSLLDGTIVKNTIEEVISKYSRENKGVRPYFEANMPVFMCLANLRGVDYALKMDGNASSGSDHIMHMHADHMTFNIKQLSSPECPFVPLKPGADQTADEENAWKQMGLAAQASGAFPMALPAQKLTRPYSNYKNRISTEDSNGEQPSNGKAKRCPQPCDLEGGGTDYEFSCVDGGTFNNEPFELCRKALLDDEGNAKKYSSVVLIDPFPDKKPDGKNPVQSLDIGNVFTKLMSSYTAQSRFKPHELARALDKNDTSLYAILPVRYTFKRNRGDDIDGDGDEAGDDGVQSCGKEYTLAKRPLATGFLGAFGGFLSKECRHHDFMLGRRNCQQFLRYHLVLPKDDCWFNDWEDNMKINPNFLVKDKYLPIIPLLGKMGREEYTRLPEWPMVPFDAADFYRKIEKRIATIKDALLSGGTLNFFHKALINVTYSLLIGTLIRGVIIKKIQEEIDALEKERAEGAK